MTTTDGRVRSYRVHVPASIEGAGSTPLLVALHGGTGSARQFEQTSGFDGLADAHGFIVVYPDGTPIGGSSPLARGEVWNGGRCCGPAARQGVDDVAFVAAVVDAVSKQHHVDPARIYATGHSNGAIMAYRLACERSETFVAIGVQAGSLEVDACDPSQPVSVMHVHGTADANIPIGGGRGRAGISGVAFSPPRDAARTFARADGCASHPVQMTTPRRPAVTIDSWESCRDASAVEFVAVAGATHAWMGHPGTRAATALTGAPYAGFDASAEIWAFLAAHPRTVPANG